MITEDNKNENKIDIQLADGQWVEGLILFTFEANGDNFVLYELDDQAFAAKIDVDQSLKPIAEDEWNLVEKTYQAFIEDQEKKING